jgi:hypothetical protein
MERFGTKTDKLMRCPGCTNTLPAGAEVIRNSSGPWTCLECDGNARFSDCLPQPLVGAACRLTYDPITGDLRWKGRPRSEFKTVGAAKAWNTKYAGQAAGTGVHGRLQITFEGQTLQAARVAYEIATGKPPMGCIKYRDGNPFNLKFDNLVLRKAGKRG